MIPRSSRCPFLANEVGLDSAGPNWVVVVVVVGLERHRLAVSCPSSSIPLTEWSTGHNSHAGATQQWSINMSRPGQCARASDGKPRPFTAVRSRKSNEKKETNKKKRNPANLKRKRRRKLVSRCRQNGERKNSNTITDHGRTSAKKNLPQTTVSLHFYTIASLQLLLIVIISVTCVYVIFLFKCYHRDKKIGGNSMKNVHELRNSVNGAKMLFWKGQNYND